MARTTIYSNVTTVLEIHREASEIQLVFTPKYTGENKLATPYNISTLLDFSRFFLVHIPYKLELGN